MAETTTMSLNISIPELLEGKVKVSSIYENFTKAGKLSSYGSDLDFPELRLSKTMKSTDLYLLGGKIENTLDSWEKKYQRHIDMQHKDSQASTVDDMNLRLNAEFETLNGILAHTLGINDAIDWETVKRKDAFHIRPEKLFKNGKKPKYIKFNSYGKPTSFDKLKPTEKPTLEKVKGKYGLFSKLFRKKVINDDFETRLYYWESEIKEIIKGNSERESFYQKVIALFENKKQLFEAEKQRENDALEDIKKRYKIKDPKAIEEYCDLVLTSSEYPDYFPQNWVLEYRASNHLVIVDYDLPSPNQLPTAKSYSYVKSRDEIAEKSLTTSESKKLYESVLYQICIRTIHELIEADVVNAIDAVAFNGYVTSRNPGTGRKETKIIISVMADKQQFLEINLARIDPKATFKLLKGVSAASLIDLAPIPPVIQMDKTDKRFIAGRAVAANLDESVNLAAMHWDDFEHLIREMFENEFTATGGEVKVTQASSDGGVDAIAFDPDPIRGGKIVIQAKRYTNTVGVAAVRDLYGTVMNEGASKGILVTTSDFGKDSYEFAKDKPLTLLNGNNLLALLEKHGHKARINIAEAKKIQKNG